MFRGKEWHPPERQEVIDAIKDRMSLAELSPSNLEAILKNAFGDQGGIGLSDEMVADLLQEQADELNAKLASGNDTYYHNLKKLSNSVSKLETVNIVVPVYNSIHLVRECLHSVLKHTDWPYKLTIVDDASDVNTHQELERIAANNRDKITLLTNKKNRGFAATVNRGIKEYELTTKYTVLLNSDVLVTPGWLTKMIAALNSNPRNKIVNPITNNTAVINVGMSPGFSYLAMNDAFEQTSGRSYPDIMPTGFCFLVPNTLFGLIGYFDESYQNFGEETDFWMRTITWSDGKTYDRWRAVLADDTYIFHQRGASYETLGDEIHMNYRKTASQRFRAQWPSWQLWNKTFNIAKTIQPLRRPFSKSVLDHTLSKRNFTDKSVCFVTHSVEACGGMHYIADIVNAINEAGGDARVAVIQRDEQKPAEPCAELRIAPYYFTTETFLNTFTSTVFDKGIVIAATAELAPHVERLTNVSPGLIPVLHVQSYEPDLIGDSALADEFKKNFTLLPHTISSSSWITKALGTPVVDTINPGVDKKIFYPRGREKGDERPTVLIALNGQYAFKGSQRGVDLAVALDKLAKKNRKDIRIMAYGARSVQGVPSLICLGPLARTRIAQILGTEVDVFVDPAHNHSYGMPALEAIASGCLVTGWDNKGIREYLPKGYANNDFIAPNDTPVDVIAKVIFNALFDEKARKEAVEAQQKSALIQAHNREKSVSKFITALKTFDEIPKLNIVVVTPHARKHGGPTTLITMANELAARGHTVKIASIYTDFNPEVVSFTDLPLILLKESLDNLPECDVLITNSDNPFNPQLSTTDKARRKIMIKLSHNPRFKTLEEQGLNQKWDAIVTSSQWLADVCENPTKGWSYPSSKATRIGWFHYNFERMRRNMKRKVINELDKSPIIISTLVHAHPSKGSAEAGAILNTLAQHYGPAVRFIGVGEVHPSEVKVTIPNMDYVFSPSRNELADIMFKSDIWLGCSHTEGLGRMALEAMTGGAVCVLTDTGCEFAINGENAIIKPIGDLNGMANAINDLISNVEKRKHLSLKGFATAKKMSNSTEFINNLEKVIADVL